MKKIIEIENFYSTCLDIQKDLIKKKKKHRKHFHKYFIKIKGLSANLVNVEYDSVLCNYIAEISYVIILSNIYSKYLERFFSIEISYLELLRKMDSDNMFTWYKLPNKLEKKISSSINKEIIETFDLNMIIDFYEYVLDRNEKRRLGQFYTPLNIVKTIINELNIIKINIERNPTIIDPACGGGIFLAEIVKVLRRKRVDKKKLVEYMCNSIYANDINPFAVMLTKFNMSLQVLGILKGKEDVQNFIDNYSEFKNIRLRNTVSYLDKSSYDYIIGNPPYFKLVHKSFENNEFYTEVMFGQPNIYTLFIYWAIQNSAQNGQVSFIVPQSFKTGLYFKELRRKLYELKIKSLINFTSRRQIFRNVEQAVIILTFKNCRKNNCDVKIASVDEGKINEMEPYYINSRSVILNEDYDFFFFIPQKKEMYTILEKIYCNSTNLKQLDRKLLFGNGLFVWNQNKDLLINHTRADAAPIIYCNFINEFNFDHKIVNETNSEKKAFSIIDDKVSRFLLTGKRLIVQRTSSYGNFNRIRACLISKQFLETYPNYFLENHVNFLYNTTNKAELIEENIMLFLCSLLNSKVLNYVFGCKNGNTQVSASELNLLPIQFKNEKFIIEKFKEYEMTKNRKFLVQLDEIIFDNYNLSNIDIDLIKRFQRGE